MTACQLSSLSQAGSIPFSFQRSSPAKIDRLRAAAERLRPFWEAPSGDLRPLHGDVHPGNLIATRDGPVWIDFEEACRGPVEWDLALLSWSDADAVAAHHRPDPELLTRCSDLRALHLALCLIAFRDDFGDLDGWDQSIRGFLTAITPTP
ncbi:MAG: phosphotransferase family protein [Pseudonocardiaceae bacterium]